MARTWEIGEPYRNSEIGRKGNAVVRPAVFQEGLRPRVITSEPCCHGVRMIELQYFEDEMWREKCNGCGAYFGVSLVHHGDIRLGGLIGVKWTA